jgi:1,4-dihydroxy-2-naphthoate octaprenyltransferase
MTARRLMVLASRPATLPASISPVLVGVSIAAHDNGVRTSASLLALVVAVALQVGVNYANDYSDFRRGADTPARIGPVRAAASGLVAPGLVLTAALLAFGVAAAAGIAVASLSAPWLIAVGACCIAAAWLYTGGPRPYGYEGLGEMFVFLFFGLVATCGTVFVNESRVPPLAVLGGVATGCLAAAVLLLNNIRDVDTDAAAGKRTLAVRIGRSAARRVLFAAVALAYLMPVIAVVTRQAGPLLLLPLLSAALVVRPLALSSQRTGPPLIRALVGTARTLAAYSVLWALGTVFS